MGCSTSDEVSIYRSKKEMRSNMDNMSNNMQQSNRRRKPKNNKNQENDSEEVQRLRLTFEPYMQSRYDPYFNFPEVPDKKYVGTGLKKMKGYISNISMEDLQIKRKQFWSSRIEGKKETWEFLQQICENKDFQNEDIQAYLSAYDIVPYNKCINVTYDSSGSLYEIPNYCIHDPMIIDLPEEHKKKT